MPTIFSLIICRKVRASMFTTDDVLWGQLGGCMEAIDAGTTTVVDHAHMNYSADQDAILAYSALSATVSSGIRSFFCYCPTPRIASWAPFQMSDNLLPEWVSTQLADLAAKQPFGDGRVRLGFGFDGFFLPKEVVVGLFEQVRAIGVKLITSHYVRNAVTGNHSLVGLLASYGLLAPDILLSHATGATSEDAAQIAVAHAHVSSTPDTELQMALGAPVCFRADLQPHASLGVDCHSSAGGGVLAQMHLALQSARGTHNEAFVREGKVPRAVNVTAEAAFNLGTIMGARAVGMGAEVGSIAVGKLADLVIFDGESPAMVCAGTHDPVAAVVLHASVRDIDTVIVDGRIRKSGGKLVAVQVGGKTMEWADVAKELQRGRVGLQDKIDKLDMEGARKATIKRFYIDESKIVDHI
ncbi:hypothetical protein B0H10DRAFT_2067845 [Mycena sp. CBHHK59/15]|nr:hypothetical protein B0H10DRAFT_2067845 [Mycena sp. CBHHK59/15]